MEQQANWPKLLLMMALICAGNTALGAVCDGMSWQRCAVSAKAAITNANSPTDAVAVYGEWAILFRSLYEAQSGIPVSPSDLDNMEGFVSNKIDAWTSPADMALDMAIKRYFPKIAAILEFASGPVVQGVWILLVPSPIATDLQDAQTANDDLGKLLMIKLSPALKVGWRDSYDQAIQDALAARMLPAKP